MCWVGSVGGSPTPHPHPSLTKGSGGAFFLSFKKRGRETSMFGCLYPTLYCGTWPTTQACALPGNQSYRQPFGSQAGSQPTEPHQPGHKAFLVTKDWKACGARLGERQSSHTAWISQGCATDGNKQSGFKPQALAVSLCSSVGGSCGCILCSGSHSDIEVPSTGAWRSRCRLIPTVLRPFLQLPHEQRQVGAVTPQSV